ncbi:Lacal_2735 family protein [Reichenbachiella sp.]
MFGLFNRFSKVSMLEKKYAKLMKDSHRLSTINRAQSDLKFAEAQSILDQLDKIKT